MKRSAMFLLAALLASGAAHAQAPQPPANMAPPPANLAQRQVRRLMMPPKSSWPHGRAAQSTAQTLAARARVPLKALPSFAVTGLDGREVAVGSVARPQHWLLLYRLDRCLACDAVMTALSANRSSTFKQGAAYVIVVAGRRGTRNTGMLDRLKAKYPALDSATWVEDDKGAAFAALKPRGAPTLYAMNGAKVAWTLPGGFNDPSKVERIAAQWMASSSGLPAASATTPKTSPSAVAPVAAPSSAPTSSVTTN